MSDSLEALRRGAMATHSARIREAAEEPEPPEEEACSAFGCLRGRDRAVMIEFRLANGTRRAFPYSWLGPVTYDPSTGILLKFVGDVVTLVLIEGSNLNAPVDGGAALYDRGLLRHRVVWVREMSAQEARMAGEGEVVIERVRMVTHRQDEEPSGVEWLRRLLEEN